MLQLVGFRACTGLSDQGAQMEKKEHTSRETGKQASQESPIHSWMRSTESALSPLLGGISKLATSASSKHSRRSSKSSEIVCAVKTAGRHCPDCESRTDPKQKTCQICGFNFEAGTFEEKVDLSWVMTNVKFRGADGARTVSVPLLDGDSPSTPSSPSSSFKSSPTPARFRAPDPSDFKMPPTPFEHVLNGNVRGQLASDRTDVVRALSFKSIFAG
ncbi:hypothetical protein T484DRAFT_1930644 [Baffinella frigidus]|nr:hypothetical protein T484DRAFT_1930644 [Cryptophyta sp. CCMP2293]